MKKISIIILLLVVACKGKENTNKIVKKKEEKKVKNNVELVYKIPSKLGEGAIWNYTTNELYWIDIEAKKLHIYQPQKNINKTITMPSRIGTVVPTKQENKAVVALEDGVYIVDTVTEELSVLSDVESKTVTNRFNDGKCDPNGNLWVGSMHLKQSKPDANLYKINPEGKAEKMLSNITISNGIVWSKDAKTMYYIDTPTMKIRAFDFDAIENTISNERVVVEVNEKEGFPDGMAIDENDMLWVGMWNGDAVAQFNPKTGKLINKIKVPAHNVTSCAFGGENLDELYITTATVDMTEEEQRKYPLAGSVFKVKMNVKGVKSPFFNKKQ